MTDHEPQRSRWSLDGRREASAADGPAAGELWAYRYHFSDPLVSVRVIRLGSQRPQRTLVRFVDDAFEGREEWVPPARLKAPWQDVDAFIAREQRWDAVSEASDVRDMPEGHAADLVFSKLIDESLATVGFNATDGIVSIHDVTRLAALLALEPDALRSDPLSFVEAGDLIAPWAVTRLIATRAAERSPDEILRDVEDDEATARREAIFGSSYERRGKASSHMAAEWCAEYDEKHGRPVREVLRTWCGQEAAERWDELAALRAEVVRLGQITAAALEALRSRGGAHDADRLERELGVPVATLRAT